LRLGLAAEHAHLGGERYRARLEEALSEHLGTEVRLELDEEVPTGAATPAEQEQRAADERVREAERTIQSDPVVRQLQDRFGATVDEGTVQPLDEFGADADSHDQ
jgi:DNA polymerase III subunit gamma/tau